MSNLEIIHTNSFIASASDYILGILERVLRRQEFFCMSLCGGSTPFPVYSELARQGKDIPWNRIIITFGDERCVPPDHEQSNYGVAKRKFLDYVPIPEENILRMKGELEPQEAAADYERQMEAAAVRCGIPSFNHDLLLLGMGDDGHTASLFPGTDALSVMDRRVVHNFVPKLNSYRITFTLPFINQANRVVFLVSDSKKDPVVREVLAGKGEYPAELVRPVEAGTLTWFLGWLPHS
jgi:6-phosphogluconolactonase